MEVALIPGKEPETKAQSSQIDRGNAHAPQLMAGTTWKALSGHALAASAGIYSRRCAGRAAPAATAFRRAQASAASSPSSPPPPPPHAKAASLSLGGSCHRSHGVWICSTYGIQPVSTLPPLAMPFP
ncbi:unnamed protein product [Musa hybrid cultivar]